MKETTKEKLLYRVAMQVTKTNDYQNGYVYPVCPRCNSSMEREFQFYCDRCGQKLDWKRFRIFIEL